MNAKCFRCLPLLLLALPLLTGCGDSSTVFRQDSSVLPMSRPAAAETVREGSEPPADMSGQVADGQSPLAGRKLIHNGALTIGATQPEEAVVQARSIAQRLGGYAQEMTLNSITLRVPGDRFEETLDQLAQLGTVIDRSVKAQDVTEAYADLELRLKSRQAMLERYRQMLARAEGMDDMLKLEKAIVELEVEIEQLQAQLRNLANQVVFSRIDLEVVPSTEVAHRHLMPRLPFWWLYRLGLEDLTAGSTY